MHDDAAEIANVIEAAVAEGRSYAFEMRVVTPKANERIVAVRATVLTDKEGRSTSIYGRATDVTSLNREDEELWRLANLDRLTNIAKGRCMVLLPMVVNDFDVDGAVRQHIATARLEQRS